MIQEFINFAMHILFNDIIQSVMKKIIPILLLVVALTTSCDTNDKQESRMKLWYDTPADEFIEALVMGNGQMGATIYGGVSSEKISLNEITLWSGEPVNSNADTEASKEALCKIRKALANEKYYEANKLQRHLQGGFSQSYQPMATLHIDFGDSPKATDYRRELDLKTATTKIGYSLNGTRYTRTCFISHPDKVMAIELVAKGRGAINGEISLPSLLHHTSTTADGILITEGYAPYNITHRKEVFWDEDRGIHFATLAKPVEYDGKITFSEDKLQLHDCKRVVLLITAATSFNGYDKDPVREGRDYMAIARQQLANAEKLTFKELRKRHIADYSSLFNRVDIEFNGEDKSHIPTDQRLQEYTNGGEDRDLEALYLHFSRYLTISASRTNSVPMNLQGIWNEALHPEWKSNYTTNINIEQNYWPTEVMNLSELHEPMLSFISNLAKTGTYTARNYFDCSGWAACHNSDIWAMSNPVGEQRGKPRWANWNMGGGWMATHLWEHYLYTLDREYLAERAYPLLKGAAEFCCDFLVEDKQGYLVPSPSTSPENEFIDPSTGKIVATCYGSTCDLAIIREVLTATISAADVLDIDKPLQEKWQSTVSQLYPYQISPNGYLQEWYHDFKERDPQHRHLSHLIGLFPFNQITPTTTPELAEAVKQTLHRRGDRAMGWSTGWRIGLYARLLDSEKAYSIYRLLLNVTRQTKQTYKGIEGGTYPNMLDVGPPFQIDGNLGAPAGVVELLLQSQSGAIDLLPALPSAWKSGSFRGLRARGAFEIDLKWRNGAVESGSILSLAGERCKVRSRTPISVNVAEYESRKEGDFYVVEFDTECGKKYKIR